MSRKYADVGALMKGKNGGLYIKLDENTTVTITQKRFNGETVTVEIPANGYINLDKPEEKYKRIFKGDEQKVTERLEKTPEYVKYLVSASQEV